MKRTELKALIVAHLGEFPNDNVLAKHLVVEHHMNTALLDGTDPHGFWTVRNEIRAELSRVGIADPPAGMQGGEALMKKLRDFLKGVGGPIKMSEIADTLQVSIADIVKAVEGMHEIGYNLIVGNRGVELRDVLDPGGVERIDVTKFAIGNCRAQRPTQ